MLGVVLYPLQQKSAFGFISRLGARGLARQPGGPLPTLSNHLALKSGMAAPGQTLPPAGAALHGVGAKVISNAAGFDRSFIIAAKHRSDAAALSVFAPG